MISFAGGFLYLPQEKLFPSKKKLAFLSKITYYLKKEIIRSSVRNYTFISKVLNFRKQGIIIS